MSELFGAYTASFLHGLSVYAHVEASMSAGCADTPPPYITLSQRLTADQAVGDDADGERGADDADRDEEKI